MSVVCKYKALCQSEVVKLRLGVSHPVLQEQENTQAKNLVQPETYTKQISIITSRCSIIYRFSQSQRRSSRKQVCNLLQTINL